MNNKFDAYFQDGGLGADEYHASWVGSMQSFLRDLSGFACGLMVRRFGWRVATILGTLIAAVGFITSAFAPNILIMYFTYGGLTGIGMGFMFFTSQV